MQGAWVRSLVGELDPACMPQLRACMLQLSPHAVTKIPRAVMKILCAETKTRSSQKIKGINTKEKV